MCIFCRLSAASVKAIAFLFSSLMSSGEVISSVNAFFGLLSCFNSSMLLIINAFKRCKSSAGSSVVAMPIWNGDWDTVWQPFAYWSRSLQLWKIDKKKRNNSIDLFVGHFLFFFLVSKFALNLPCPQAAYVCRWMKTLQTCRITLTNFTQEVDPLFFFDAIWTFHVHRSLFSHNLQREHSKYYTFVSHDLTWARI